jgi:hypothetical protein
MKKCMAVLSIFGVVLALGCDYDDSNDIDILTPNDSTETGLEEITSDSHFVN